MRKSLHIYISLCYVSKGLPGGFVVQLPPMLIWERSRQREITNTTTGVYCKPSVKAPQVDSAHSVDAAQIEDIYSLSHMSFVVVRRETQHLLFCGQYEAG